MYENRSIEESLDIAWELLRTFPRNTLRKSRRRSKTSTTKGSKFDSYCSISTRIAKLRIFASKTCSRCVSFPISLVTGIVIRPSSIHLIYIHGLFGSPILFGRTMYWPLGWGDKTTPISFVPPRLRFLYNARIASRNIFYLPRPLSRNTSFCVLILAFPPLFVPKRKRKLWLVED